MSFKFNQATLDVLKSFGWTEDRVVDTTAYEQHFVETNQPVSPQILAFLESFGGFQTTRETPKGSTHHMRIDPLVQSIWSEKWRKYYKIWIGSSFCIIGDISSHAALLMTPTGTMYSVFGEYVTLLGTTVEDAFDYFLVRKNRNRNYVPKPQELIPPKPKPPSPPPEGTDFGIKHNKDWTPIFQTVTIREIDFEMCKVPRGVFIMGRDDGRRFSRPQHFQYMVKPYWIAVHPITNSQWQIVVERSNQTIQAPKYISSYDDPKMTQHPVVGVTGEQCREFVKWLGEGFRLPTEPEWEFAARCSDNLIYPYGNEFQPDLVVYRDNSNNSTSAIGGRSEGVSWVGAQDMCGNVWEWTNSVSYNYPYNADAVLDSEKPKKQFCVGRGGSYRVDIRVLDTSSRYHLPCNTGNRHIGFRVVLDI